MLLRKSQFQIKAAAFGGFLLACAPCVTWAVTVPGTSNPYLAGMPNGTPSVPGDVAPAQSPVLVSGLCLRAGSALNFTATGAVSNDPNTVLFPLVGPDGNTASITQHGSGPENGISNITAPYNCLVGVFLSASAPNLSSPPAMLSFVTPASRDYLSLSPVLQQLFFIGNGTTSANVVQQVIVPVGATRLYLGTLDVGQWANNPGQFEVTVFDPCPTPVAEKTWGATKSLWR